MKNKVVFFLFSQLSVCVVDKEILKGESVVAAILPSHMEVSYCTSGFLCS